MSHNGDDDSSDLSELSSTVLQPRSQCQVSKRSNQSHSAEINPKQPRLEAFNFSRTSTSGENGPFDSVTDPELQADPEEYGIEGVVERTSGSQLFGMPPRHSYF